MSGKTEISWATDVWNPTTGCTRVSAGCDHCYAFTLHDQRHEAFKQGAKLPAQYAKPFSEVQLLPDRLEQPLRWRKPRRIFLDSMSDLFHAHVPVEYLDKVFGVMAAAPHHQFLILTKRPLRMRQYLQDEETKRRIWHAGRPIAERILGKEHYDIVPIPEGKGGHGPEWCYPRQWPLPNVWLGTSVEDQAAADTRIEHLLNTPAAIRFLSCEPLLGPVDLHPYLWEEAGPAWAGSNVRYPGLDWIIVGGESGPDYRPLDLDWARSLERQARTASVAFWFKQVGGRTSKAGGDLLDGKRIQQFPHGVEVVGG